MNEAVLYGIGAAVLVLVVIAASAIRIVPEYERGVIFRLGRVIDAKGPGLFVIIPIVDRMVKVSLRTITQDIPPQDIITRDNVTVRVNAVAYYNVVDPVKAIIAIENYIYGTSQVAQTTLRSIIGRVDLDDLLAKRDEINQDLQQIIDSLTNPWGVKVTLVEVKDVELPDSMRRLMARQAESERDRRAKVIHALGEKEAAENLAGAAELLEVHPSAMQLRVLSTMTEVASDKNSTLVFPIPVELLRFFDSYRQTDAAPPSARPPAATPVDTATGETSTT
jgi:regulator of protease activity HflC (stomatin/prohibitin superfamily)